MKSHRILAALALACALLLGAGSPSSADSVPPITKKLAKKLKCKWPHSETLAGGGKNSGVECRVNNGAGRQDIYVLKYRNMTRALDFWQDWLQVGAEAEVPPGCIVKKKAILIIPMGGGSGVDYDAYAEKWCQYIAVRVGGQIIYGYPS
ncbi:hypothetical protein [Nocardioides nitrophenolicus]|uniref:hypothetical protein n=1 Tax=Nocardioides nitrophenolicus TaxID=60489 RepID=UPI001956D78D|nr:hypothetical protein [Nocardioides nitrophenolicus]MBM7518253.1 hypothetical protein [Nocardioides nitrophenolicus]